MDFTIVNQTTQNSNKKIQNVLELRCNNEGSPTYQDNIISDMFLTLDYFMFYLSAQGFSH